MANKVINWTPKKLDKFRKAYDLAVARKQNVFMFEGNEFVQGYAKYLIEYLDMEFDHQAELLAEMLS